MTSLAADQTERSVFVAFAYGAPILSLQLFLVLPALGRLFFGGGHPSGEVIGLLAAVGFSISNGLLGTAATVVRLRTHRSPLLFLALLLNLALVISPAFWFAVFPS